jgi:hypothetical protein
VTAPELVRAEDLELMQVQDRVAEFESQAPPTLGDPLPNRVVVRLPFREWTDLGRPTTIRVQYVVTVP